MDGQHRVKQSTHKSSSPIGKGSIIGIHPRLRVPIKMLHGDDKKIQGNGQAKILIDRKMTMNVKREVLV